FIVVLYSSYPCPVDSFPTRRSSDLNQRASVKLSENLEELGFDLTRFSTGTPPRVHNRSVDYSKTEEQPGDDKHQGFSYETTEFIDRKSTRLNSSHVSISYAVFFLKQ